MISTFALTLSARRTGLNSEFVSFYILWGKYSLASELVVVAYLQKSMLFVKEYVHGI
jgi:hypothetical protein